MHNLYKQEELIKKIKKSELNDNIKTLLTYEAESFHCHPNTKDDEIFIFSLFNTFLNNAEFFNNNIQNFHYDMIKKSFNLSRDFFYLFKASKEQNRDLYQDTKEIEKNIKKLIVHWNKVDDKIFNLIRSLPRTHNTDEFDAWISHFLGTDSKMGKIKDLYNNLIKPEKNYFESLHDWNRTKLERIKTYSREFKRTPEDMFKFITKELYSMVFDTRYHKLNIPPKTMIKELINLIIIEHNKLVDESSYIYTLSSNDISQITRNLKK